MLRFTILLSAAFAILAPLVPLSAQMATITVLDGPDSTVISRHIYGHFAEHLGRSIYGGFYVGEGNDSIANVDGLRSDVIEALRRLQIPNLRWPGGCFADTYHWRDGVGPRDERPTMVNTNWGGVTEDNSFGTHNFLQLCDLLDTEPYLAANIGSGTVQELADWVQYVNYPGTSPMSDDRRRNGRAEPWGVRYWGVGNEAWGCGGNMRVEYYADLYRRYATYMSGAGLDGGLYRVAAGATDGDYHWTEVLMRDVPHHLMQGISLHHYSVIDWSGKGPAVGFDESQYMTTMQRSWAMEEMVTKHSAVMDVYDPAKKVGLIVDEWGGWYDVEPGTNPGFLYQQNTMRDAMIAGMNLNIFNNHADRVHMANLAQAVNVLQAVILTEGNQLVLTPTYHVMEMYKVHQDATRVPIRVESPEYAHGGETLPAISASASRATDGTLHVSVVNIDYAKAHMVTITLPQNYVRVSGRVLRSERMQDYNGFGEPGRIEPEVFAGVRLKGRQAIFEVPAGGVVVVGFGG